MFGIKSISDHSPCTWQIFVKKPSEQTEKEANNGTLTFITSLHFSHYSKQ